VEQSIELEMVIPFAFGEIIGFQGRRVLNQPGADVHVSYGVSQLMRERTND
jgi:hypothetical protein